MEDKLTDMVKQSDDDARLNERREVKGAYQVWRDQLRRVNRYYARFETINQNRLDPLHYAADDAIVEYEKDDIYSFFVHCYQLVDWFGVDAKYRHCKGKNPCQRTSCPKCWVNSHEALAISRDLCNWLKHVRLDRGKPGKPRPIRETRADLGFIYEPTHLIQWPDRATFDKKWCEIQRENPDAFQGKTSETGFNQGYWDDGYEQECWLAAFQNGERRDLFKVATEAREDWKQFFVAPEADKDWTQIYFYYGGVSTDELYEKALGPGSRRVDGVLGSVDISL